MKLAQNETMVRTKLGDDLDMRNVLASITRNLANYAELQMRHAELKMRLWWRKRFAEKHPPYVAVLFLRGPWGDEVHDVPATSYHFDDKDRLKFMVPPVAFQVIDENARCECVYDDESGVMTWRHKRVWYLRIQDGNGSYHYELEGVS